MPSTTFEDPDLSVEDPEGVLNGSPRATMPAPSNDERPDTEPPPAQRRPPIGTRRKSAIGRRKSPQQKNQDSVAKSQGLEPGETPAPLPEDARDVRFWWPKILKEEFIDKGCAPSDARLYVYRERAERRPGEKPTQMPPTIYGNQVVGHENQSAGDALVQLIILRYHPDARGPATYKIRCMNANPARGGTVGMYGTLDLESPDELEQRRLRIEALEGKTPPAPQTVAPFGLPRVAMGAPQVPVPVAVGTSPPGVTPAAPPVPDFMQQMMMMWLQEMMTAAREGRQPVMPAMMQPPPAPKPEDEDARIIKIVETLIAAGVITRQPGAAPPPAPAADPWESLYQSEVAQEKRDKIIIGAARRRGMISKDELPPVEVPAPEIEDDDPKKERQDGEGVVGYMMRRFADEFAKDPGKFMRQAGELLQGPFGNMIREMLLKQGVGLPHVGTAAGVVGGGGGFTPTT